MQLVSLLLSSIILFSCNKDNHVRTYKLPKINADIFSSSETSESTSLSFKWIVPDSWEMGKKSSMRLASYNAPYNGEYADISITNFSGDGGGLLANVNRWRRQLNLEPQNLDEINDLIIYKSSGLGDYKLLKIVNNENIDFAFLCAIMQIEQSTIFVKMKASLKGINILQEEFITFCSSFN